MSPRARLPLCPYALDWGCHHLLLKSILQLAVLASFGLSPLPSRTAPAHSRAFCVRGTAVTVKSKRVPWLSTEGQPSFSWNAVRHETCTQYSPQAQSFARQTKADQSFSQKKQEGPLLCSDTPALAHAPETWVAWCTSAPAFRACSAGLFGFTA